MNDHANPPPPWPRASGAGPEPSLAASRTLESLRSELDGIDARILELLRQRLEVSSRIGWHKKRHSIPMLQPARIEIVQTRAEAFAAVHGMRLGFARALYALIIEESCWIENDIMRAGQGA